MKFKVVDTRPAYENEGTIWFYKKNTDGTVEFKTELKLKEAKTEMEITMRYKVIPGKNRSRYLVLIPYSIGNREVTGTEVSYPVTKGELKGWQMGDEIDTGMETSLHIRVCTYYKSRIEERITESIKATILIVKELPHVIKTTGVVIEEMTDGERAKLKLLGKI